MLGAPSAPRKLVWGPQRFLRGWAASSSGFRHPTPKRSARDHLATRCLATWVVRIGSAAATITPGKKSLSENFPTDDVFPGAYVDSISDQLGEFREERANARPQGRVLDCPIPHFLG
jgi:hypothetical protein